MPEQLLRHGDDATRDVLAPSEQLVDDHLWDADGLLDAQVLGEDDDDDGGVVIRANRREVAAGLRPSPAQGLDLEQLAARGPHVPRGLGERGTPAAVVQGHEGLGDVPDGVVEGPHDLAVTKLAKRLRPEGEHLPGGHLGEVDPSSRHGSPIGLA